MIQWSWGALTHCPRHTGAPDGLLGAHDLIWQDRFESDQPLAGTLANIVAVTFFFDDPKNNRPRAHNQPNLRMCHRGAAVIALLGTDMLLRN
jgi:hypothetical protein